MKPTRPIPELEAAGANRSEVADASDQPPGSLSAVIVYGTGEDTGAPATERGPEAPATGDGPSKAWIEGDWAGTAGHPRRDDGPETAIEAAVAAVGAWPNLIDRPSEVTIVLATDDEVAALNGRYRGQPKPTNVLSFPASPRLHHESEDEPVPRAAIGDIILAGETVMREAGDLGVPSGHHLQHLVVHGLLHLLGHDHDTDEAAVRMETLEVEILATLGVADPYAGTVPLDARDMGGV